jgi:hypothetical protein
MYLDRDMGYTREGDYLPSLCSEWLRFDRGTSHAVDIVAAVEVRNSHTHWLGSLNAGYEAGDAVGAVLGVVEWHSCGMRVRYLSRVR